MHGDKVVTCCRFMKVVLGIREFHRLMIEKELERPECCARFYFNYADAWVPLELSKVVEIAGLDQYTQTSYHLLYFTSRFPLPRPPKQTQILSSPLGLLSIPLYLNQISSSEPCISLPYNSELIPFPYFPGTEGSFYKGKMLVPSKFKGYCIAYNLPKI